MERSCIQYFTSFQNLATKFWNEDSFNKLTVESLVERQISSVNIGWHPSMSSRAQQNIKLTKLFTKCSTNPAVKCLIIEDWEIQDDIRDHLPDRSLTGLIQSTDMLKEVLKRLINLQQLVISDQHSLDDIPQSSRISKEN